MFLDADANGNGDVDIFELAEALHKVGISLSQSELLAFRGDLDFDGDGAISLDEFLMAARIHIRSADAQAGFSGEKKVIDDAWEKILTGATSVKQWARKVEQFFLKADRDGNGKIDAQELSSALAATGVHMNPKEIEAFRNDILDDPHEDITIKQFLAAVRTRQRMKSQSHASSSQIDVSSTFSTAHQKQYQAACEQTWEKILSVVDNDPTAPKVLYSSLDANGSNLVDVTELASALSTFGIKMTAKEIVAFRDTMDCDGDYRISYQDFMRTIEHRQQLRQDRQDAPTLDDLKQGFLFSLMNLLFLYMKISFSI